MVTPAALPPVSPLFVPADRPERFAKAAASGADAVILDLEDAVAPEAKVLARKHAATHPERPQRSIVRINALGSDWFSEDLAALRHSPPMAIMLPKAESAADVAAVRAGMGMAIPVLALVETARGLDGLGGLLVAEGVWAAAFGSLDYALDLGSAHKWEALLLARCELVLRSRLAGLPPPIDGVSVEIDDPEIAHVDARRALGLGFGGKLAIHPRQVEPILSAFAISDAKRAWAARIVAVAASGAVQRIDGKMVDRPVIERASRVLARVGR